MMTTAVVGVATSVLAPLRRGALAAVAKFEPDELADTAFAYAAAGVEAPELFETIRAASAKRLDAFDAAELADVTFALARAARPRRGPSSFP